VVVKFGGETEFSAALEPGRYLALLLLQEEGSFSENERASKRAVCRKGVGQCRVIERSVSLRALKVGVLYN